jgi:hypothetical protein
MQNPIRLSRMFTVSALAFLMSGCASANAWADDCYTPAIVVNTIASADGKTNSGFAYLRIGDEQYEGALEGEVVQGPVTQPTKLEYLFTSVEGYTLTLFGYPKWKTYAPVSADETVGVLDLLVRVKQGWFAGRWIKGSAMMVGVLDQLTREETFLVKTGRICR